MLFAMRDRKAFMRFVGSALISSSATKKLSAPFFRPATQSSPRGGEKEVANDKMYHGGSEYARARGMVIENFTAQPASDPAVRCDRNLTVAQSTLEPTH